MATAFRETLWFKKGELDIKEAQRAAQDKDDLHPAAADLLPVEDRYLDDGNLTAEDRAAFSLRTGATQMVPRVGPGTPTSDGGDLAPLLAPLKRGRLRVLAMIAGGLALACAVVLAFA